MPIAIQPVARDMMRAISEETGVSMAEMMTRYLEFLTSLGPAFAVSVLNRNPGTPAETGSGCHEGPWQRTLQEI